MANNSNNEWNLLPQLSYLNGGNTAPVASTGLAGFQQPNNYWNGNGQAPALGALSGITDPQGLAYGNGTIDWKDWGGGAPTEPSFFSMDSIFGKRNADGSATSGWGGTAMDLGKTAMNAYMGMKQYGLAKDQLAESKKQFETNFNAQKGLTNSSLEDRQRARIASNAGAYQSVGDYMNKNGVK